MGGSPKKALNKLGRNVKHILGEKAYNIGKQLTGLGQLQTHMNLMTGKSIRESLSENISVGTNDHMFDKPDLEKEDDDKPATVDTAALAAAMDEEEEKRKKKRGFSANVFGSDFRFGGAAPAAKNNTGGQL